MSLKVLGITWYTSAENVFLSFTRTQRKENSVFVVLCSTGSYQLEQRQQQGVVIQQQIATGLLKNMVNSLWLCSVSCTKLFGILTGLRYLYLRVTWLGNSLPIEQLTASSPSTFPFSRIQLKVVASVSQQKLPSWKKLHPSILQSCPGKQSFLKRTLKANQCTLLRN